MTAYQRGQCAGFLRREAEQMVLKGACRILTLAEPAVVDPAPASHQGKQQRAAA